ncbi:hypothetical protein [Paraburkholderia sp. BCC1885]|uniref:hypothetical protein n=1 Tax=Paraburkholderia sp. BCC1885 TaxID=2562669 RepID=UPI0011828E81|nr:hypothetical protein [Paraburkholderia sp. BCC1885]
MQNDSKPDSKPNFEPQDTGAHDANETTDETQRDTRTAAQKQEAERTDPQRTSQRPKQTAEVPLGTGNHGEPPGGGGRQSQRVATDKPDRH